MFKEDFGLFPAALATLDGADWDAMDSWEQARSAPADSVALARLRTCVRRCTGATPRATAQDRAWTAACRAQRQVRVSGRRPRLRVTLSAAFSSPFTSTGRSVPANNGRSDGASL